MLPASIKRANRKLSNGLEKSAFYIERYLNENLWVIIALLIVVAAGYGFELFNLNITIDEELYALNKGSMLPHSANRVGDSG